MAYIKTITKCALENCWFDKMLNCLNLYLLFVLGYTLMCVCMCYMAFVHTHTRRTKSHAMHSIQNFLAWNLIQMKGIVTQIVLFHVKSVAYILASNFPNNSNRISNYDLCWGLIFNQNQISKYKPSLLSNSSILAFVVCMCVYIYVCKCKCVWRSNFARYRFLLCAKKHVHLSIYTFNQMEEILVYLKPCWYLIYKQEKKKLLAWVLLEVTRKDAYPMQQCWEKKLSPLWMEMFLLICMTWCVIVML